MLPVQQFHLASLIVLATICAGLDLLWFARPTNNMLSSNTSNEFNYCGHPPTSKSGSRIVNGVEASKNEFPWIAKLLVDFVTVGAGSLITDRHILTAAHCLVFYNESVPLFPHCTSSDPRKNYEALPVSFFSFVLGSYATVNLPKDKVLQTLSYVLHPQFDIFNSGQEVIQVNDIAIATIAPVTFSHRIVPICLPLPNEAIPNWMKVTVAGWGTIVDSTTLTQNSSVRSQVLMKTSLTYVPFEYCTAYTNLQPYLTRRNCIAPYEKEILCLYGNNTDSCRGDSGGPVMSQQFNNFYTVAGIVSWGIGCNRPNTPSAYTNVRQFFKWIMKHTRDGFYLPRPPLDQK
uniref:Prostasin n=1 Tax=Lygus hesperus TaxID=30085 RepID=A0A0A9X9B2_LYGHE